MKQCSFCLKNTLIAGTLVIYSNYRCEDKDYIVLREEDSNRVRGYFEILRYCPSCLRKYCIGKKR